jgi:hypothetical protein
VGGAIRMTSYLPIGERKGGHVWVVALGIFIELCWSLMW